MSTEIVIRSTAVGVHAALANTVAQLFLLEHRGQTRQAYGTDIRQWFEFCHGYSVDPLKAERAHVAGWIRSMGEARPATLQRKLSAIRNFYMYAVDQNYCDVSPVPFKDKTLHLPKVSKKSVTLGPDASEARRLVEAASARSLRDEVVLKILLHQGLRVSELCALDVQDISRQRGHVAWRLTRKGGAEETQVLAPEVVEVLQRYLRRRKSGPLVLNNAGGRLIRKQINRIVELAVMGAGTRPFSPHGMRHACATLLLDEGVPLRDVQVFLGHADSSTTERYDLGRKIISDKSPAYALTGVFD